MPNTTRRNGWKRWSEDDLRELRELARAAVPKELIGLRMGRSPEAVAQRAWLEGVSLPGRRSRALPRERSLPRSDRAAVQARDALPGRVAGLLPDAGLRDAP